MYFVNPPYFLKRIFNTAVWDIPTKEKVIYLTFDDGPIPEITPWVLDTLKQYGAKATFFCIGENIKKHPDIFQRTISEKHSIGNHTYNHLNGWKTSTNEYIENIRQCDSVINSNQLSVISDQSNSLRLPNTDYRLPLFRPPYGRITPSQYLILSTQYSLIMWDVLSGDFDRKTSGEKCLKNTLENSKPGSIVVFHDSIKAKESLQYTLPRFLEHFSKQGFSFDSLPIGQG